MEKAVDYLVAHPVLFIMAVIVAIMIMLSFFRRVMRLFLVVAAMLVLYAAWLQLTGGPTHEIFQNLGHMLNNTIRFLGDLFGHLFALLKFPKKGLV
ncbi:MAG: hypothetical protein FDX18_08770 [Chlorobium sp.]|nr:MAG: hypothetical protein FDX18_08770 [Chlorobium sp.]